MKETTKHIIQRTYEILCGVACVGILSMFKDIAVWYALILLLPFALVAFTKNEKAKTISFGIFFGILSYGAWTFAITAWTTNLLERAFGLPEHSLWDIFAFLLPLMFAATTLIWAVRERKVSDKFDRFYFSILAGVIFIFAMC